MIKSSLVLRTPHSGGAGEGVRISISTSVLRTQSQEGDIINHSLFLLSIKIVTGPSLIREIFISAANTPVLQGLGRSEFNC